MPLALALLYALVSQSVQAAYPLTCGCEWSPWTRTHYLSCIEVRSDGKGTPVVSQRPFASDSECENAAKVEKSPSREPGAALQADSVGCECDWNPWRSNFLLSCTAWRGDKPGVRIVNQLAFGSAKGHKSEAERSCLKAKDSLEHGGSLRSN
jgi:hypothetical protein